MRAQKVDTSRTRITIENLDPGKAYELVIKAGNANGTSQLTQPLTFVTADKYIIETSRSLSQTPSIIGALLAVFCLVILSGLAIWYYKGGRKLFMLGSPNNGRSTDNPTRSFENPYFNQEVTMSNLQVKIIKIQVICKTQWNVFQGFGSLSKHRPIR